MALALPPLPVRVAAPPATNGTLVARIDLTDAVARFVVEPDDAVPPFRAGQYFAIGLEVDGRLIQRPYSTASAPGAGRRLEFLVRRVPGGELTPRLWSLAPGARLRIGRPKGLFALDRDDDRTLMLVSTGTGLAPFVSMIGELRDRPHRPTTIVVHGVALQRELAYRDLLDGCARSDEVRYRPVVSRPSAPDNADWRGLSGHIDQTLPGLLQAERVDPEGTVAYLCGNPGMIARVVGVLRDAGLAPEAIRREEYWSPIRTVRE